mmetsp:Transcript_21004/g.67069  ORF Transcript_21004/g.67069 Transcript_21004/m.67069 type:complete len:251 (+) Transcript_21004:418-1170(+)
MLLSFSAPRCAVRGVVHSMSTAQNESSLSLHMRMCLIALPCSRMPKGGSMSYCGLCGGASYTFSKPKASKAVSAVSICVTLTVQWKSCGSPTLNHARTPQRMGASGMWNMMRYTTNPSGSLYAAMVPALPAGGAMGSRPAAASLAMPLLMSAVYRHSRVIPASNESPRAAICASSSSSRRGVHLACLPGSRNCTPPSAAPSRAKPHFSYHGTDAARLRTRMVTCDTTPAGGAFACARRPAGCPPALKDMP